MGIIQKLVKSRFLEKTPIWLMRQAGRYLPEYLEVKNSTKSFLEMCYNPEIVEKITLQPISRFDLDAAIIFSDILVIPNALGLNLKFEANKGPMLNKLSFDKSIRAQLTNKNTEEFLYPVYQSLKRLKTKLSPEKELIGFAGGAWTLFSYMVEGGGSKSFENANVALVKHKKKSEEIIDLLTEEISHHLIRQIESGATMLQIFDSWAGEINEDDYDKFIIEPTKRIVKNIRSKYKEIPIVAFPRGSNFKYQRFAEKVPVDILSVDQEVPLAWIKDRLQDKVIIQGNMDPMIMLRTQQEIKESFLKIEEFLGAGSYIFNLGRGVHRLTPVDNVEYLVSLAKKK